jgi:hypothetical protein
MQQSARGKAVLADRDVAPLRGGKGYTGALKIGQETVNYLTTSNWFVWPTTTNWTHEM